MYFPFVLKGIDKLDDIPGENISRIGFHIGFHGAITKLEFGFANRNLAITSVMNDVSERLEVGCVCFEDVGEALTSENMFSCNFGVLGASKIVRACDEFSSEVGIKLVTVDSEILIVTGVYPFSISVKGVKLIEKFVQFKPEYNLDDCQLADI